MSRIAIFLGAVAWLSCIACAGTQYYVSTGGDDSHDGHSEGAAWRTAAKVNGTKFAPGDSILFQRGGEWHEQLIASSDGDDQNPITYADYGDPKAAKPTFWGSDVLAPSAITSTGSSVYTFQASALPTGHVYYVFADHKFLAFATDQGNMPADSFIVTGGTVTVKTSGSDPRTGSPVITVVDRAQGTDGDSSLICSNGHNALVFSNLSGRETAAAPQGGGLPDAYIYRIMGSRNIRMNGCDAVAGGKHHIGVINTTDFIGKNLHASGCIPGLGYGNAGAFVSFSDQSRSGDTSQWIDCTVDDFQPAEQSFITHGPGLGSLLIQNLTSLGCGLGIGMDNPNEKILIKGGLLTGPTCDIYGSHIVVDGLRITKDAKIDLFGNNNIVQNCIDAKSTNPQGSIVVRGQGNIIRFNTLDHPDHAGPCISVQGSAASTQIIGNLFTGGASPSVNDGGAAGLVLNYNGFDTAGGAPQGLDHDAHLASGDPHFTDISKGDYTLGSGSFAIGKLPPSATDGPDHDALGNSRPVGGAYDIGACQTQQQK
jgi:hypothetical protein